MDRELKYVLSIAGFDPSAGAGLLADIKTLESHKVYGMGVASALTFQNDAEFDDVKWVEIQDILKQVKVLQKRFSFPFVKIGLIQNLTVLQQIITLLKRTTPDVQIIFDPIVKATAGFQFHDRFQEQNLLTILYDIFLITPNVEEAKFLTGIESPFQAAEKLSQFCNVLLKGGHSQNERGIDYLFLKKQHSSYRIEKQNPHYTEFYPKHGSGCVLSAAIAANLAHGQDLYTACKNAKYYVEKYLISHTNLLGVHYAI